MRNKQGLLNVSFESPFRWGEGNVSGTLDAVNTHMIVLCMGYQSRRMTRWRTSAKET